MRVCVFGLGEGGSTIAADLAAAGVDVAAFDPAPVATPRGVNRLPHPALAAARSALVLAITSEADAELALLQAIEVISGDAVYADLSVSKPALKKELASVAADAGVAYADVALIFSGAERGLATQSLVCGQGADRYARLVGSLGGQAEVIAGDSGQAMRRKLLRSVVLSGAAAVMAEAMRLAAASEDLDWLWGTINDEVSGADDGWLRQLVNDHETSSLYQLDEVVAIRSLFEELGVESTMSEAMSRSFQANLGTPEIPD